MPDDMPEKCFQEAQPAVTFEIFIKIQCICVDMYNMAFSTYVGLNKGACYASKKFGSYVQNVEMLLALIFQLSFVRTSKTCSLDRVAALSSK